MKKIIKFIKNNILGFLVGLSLCLNGVVIAENILTANQVTYNDSTVQTELDNLFDAVDINERLGDTSKISSIGEDGTVSGAISSLNSDLLTKVDKSDFNKLGTCISLGGTHSNGIITLLDSLDNYRYIEVQLVQSGSSVIVESQMIPVELIKISNIDTKRIIIANFIDKLYEGDFYYKSNTQLVVSNLTNVGIFFTGIK